jgi:transposase-like protein
MPGATPQDVLTGILRAGAQRMLAEADRCNEPGELGALLRREGLYSSHLTTWRKQRDAGALEALSPKQRGRKPRRQDAVAVENERLARENRRLTERLRQAETIIEVQKKVCEMLGISPASPSDDGRP